MLFEDHDSSVLVAIPGNHDTLLSVTRRVTNSVNMLYHDRSQQRAIQHLTHERTRDVVVDPYWKNHINASGGKIGLNYNALAVKNCD